MKRMYSPEYTIKGNKRFEESLSNKEYFLLTIVRDVEEINIFL